MRRLLLILLAGLSAGIGTPSPAAEDAVEPRIIVQWKREALAAQRDADIRRVQDRSGVSLQRLRAVGGRMEVLRLPDTSAATRERALSSLRANDAVEFAVPDRRVRAHSTPNDPLFVSNPSNLHLQASSPAINAGRTGYATTDYDLDPRDAAPDIGAYEY